jgi:2-dehydropantoate 2-reductase
MKIAIIGAGAIGGWMGVKLANVGHDVSVLARGETLNVLRANGLTLITGEAHINASVKATDNAVDIGAVDLVVIAVKAPSLASVAASIAPLLSSQTIVVTAMNGVPWWFFARSDRALAQASLSSIDPSGSIAAAIPVSHVIGCVVHAACSIDAPAVIRHRMGNRLIIGEAVGGDSARLSQLRDALVHAGFDTEASTDIQRDIWFKLWGNMTMNPVSAITGATGDKILRDPLVRDFCTAVMREAKTIGAKIGIEIPDTPEQRHAVTEKLGAFKTSMLQDVESGKAIELDALVSAVREIGQRVNIATPNVDALLGLTRLMAQQKGLYPSS